MLKFANLSLAQKRFVVSMLETFPEFSKEKTVTLKQIHTIYDGMRADRNDTGLKIGFPNWLLNKNKVERGVYEIPQPTEYDLAQYAKEVADKQAAKAPKAKATKTALAKVAKTVKAKTAKVAAVPVQEADVEVETDISGTRLAKIIEESEYIDEDVEDFNQILRDNGIEV